MESTKPKFRKPYRSIERKSLVPQGESRTKQSFADQCEINNIINKFQATGAITHANKHQLHYGETDGTTFHEAMNIVCEAQEAFSELPSSLRNRFGNDPAAYLDFVSNEEKSQKWQGLDYSLRRQRRKLCFRAGRWKLPPKGAQLTLLDVNCAD